MQLSPGMYEVIRLCIIRWKWFLALVGISLTGHFDTLGWFQGRRHGRVVFGVTSHRKCRPMTRINDLVANSIPARGTIWRSGHLASSTKCSHGQFRHDNPYACRPFGCIGVKREKDIRCESARRHDRSCAASRR